MRNFYLKYPICQTLSGKLTWSHYCELVYVEDEAARQFYEIESIKADFGRVKRDQLMGILDYDEERKAMAQITARFFSALNEAGKA